MNRLRWLITIVVAIQLTTLVAANAKQAAHSTGPAILQQNGGGLWQTYAFPGTPNISHLAADQFNAVWFSAGSFLGSINMQGKLSLRPTQSSIFGLTFFLHNLWDTTMFSNGDEGVGEFDSYGRSIHYYRLVSSDVQLGNIAEGPSPGPVGALWFTECDTGTGAVGRLQMNGTYDRFSLAGCPVQLVAGGDGHLWVLIAGGEVDKIAQDGSVSLVSQVPTASHIANGPDSAVWLSTAGALSGMAPALASTLVRIGYDGQVSTYPAPAGTNVENVAMGPDRNIWTYGFSPEIVQIFSVTNRRFRAPIVVPPQGAPRLTSMVEGPDANMWFSASFNGSSTVLVYEVKSLRVTPTSLTLSAPGKTGQLTITETGNQIVWSCTSSNPSIATCQRYLPATIVVTGVAPGSCVMTIADTIHNAVQVPVTVH